ncbi:MULTISPECIES: prepilin peptidase [unclassified Sphingomonas]|uniref:A24 family peptidase n=1 Tax=unclassified Sphingomonas TaxID=196159 RepID=UPI00226AF407|nr:MULTISPECIES: prepilin peptidase [unclassified Sphingomonas]
MGWDNVFAVALLVALGALLVSAGIEDARIREIANWKNAAIALAAPAWWWAIGLGWADIGVQLIVATLVFAIFCGCFAMGWMGGGDVKLIAALALWLPLGGLIQMLMVMSIAGGAITLLMLIERTLRKKQGQLEIPYGVAIAAAALLALPQTGF